jgi:Zn-dependent peptidase ImmA (M78 family)
MPGVAVKPELVRWARERASRKVADLSARFPKLSAWERGDARPTLKQLEAFAKATYTPFGYLFLPGPPEERVPIPDLRTMADRRIVRPSPDLLDTIYLCQRRQDWYADHARLVDEDRREFVASASVRDDVTRVAADMRGTLGFDLEERRRMPTWVEALRRFIEQADELGVLVMVSGVVGTNNRRKLDPEEFRGFALSDTLAPLVFINGADTKAAQMFTLAHELAHLWLGESALSDVVPVSVPTHAVEKWCNQVAAELLVPMEVLRSEVPRKRPLDAVDTLARRFKVSTLVVIRRLHDAGVLGRQEMWDAYEDEVQRLRRLPKGAGGDFYLTQSARAGKRFTRALIASALEGHTLYRDAFQLLGIKKGSTFEKWADSLGVPV